MCLGKPILFFSNKRLAKNIDFIYKKKTKVNKSFIKHMYPYFFLSKILYSNIRFTKNLLETKTLEE
jgi:hypothetical protein